LTTVLQNGWKTRQVDYKNAFAQAKLAETVFVKPPRLFSYGSGQNVVLKLLKSLYGLRQAPRTFFEKLHDGLIEGDTISLITTPVCS
jgi:histone deacetylase 1/2